ncbi:hypothetical protein QSJ19_23845 [Gordonia sp. ABSL11-1]|uniref:sunset domain-containing protein n=1 Tax=Gordonia sp. ABSL11-1 TaxID=3053924 RepID=UPI002572667D|nr:hypothetical protein [Gordonia sp. ABSL11-1]MDL9948561.1 hypothetical protein [Gordonia sp. ABSL11-1]
MTTSTRRTVVTLGVLAATTATMLSVPSAGATTRTVTAREGDESDWWWLLVPFVLILVGLVLIWIFRKVRGGSSADDGALRPPVREPAPSVTLSAAAPPGAPAPSVDSDGPTDIVAEESSSATADVPADIPPIPEFPDDVMTSPDLSVPADQHGHGDGVGSYRRGGESVPVPIGAHLPVTGSGEPPDGYSIKADAESGTYHTPDQPTYDDLAPDIWFASESAAESAHFHKAGREPGPS